MLNETSVCNVIFSDLLTINLAIKSNNLRMWIVEVLPAETVLD